MSCTDKEEDHIRNLSFSEKSPGTVTLFWETNLSSVEVFISEDLDFTTILHDTITSGQSINVNGNFYPGQPYYWRVNGEDFISIDSFWTFDPFVVYQGEKEFSVERSCNSTDCDTTFIDVIQFSKINSYNRLTANGGLTSFDHILDRAYFDYSTNSLNLFCICPRRDIFLTIEENEIKRIIKNYGGQITIAKDIYSPIK